MMQSAFSSSSSAVPIHLVLLLRVLVLVSSIGFTHAEVVLSEHIMDLAKTSAELSAAVCEFFVCIMYEYHTTSSY